MRGTARTWGAAMVGRVHVVRWVRGRAGLVATALLASVIVPVANSAAQPAGELPRAQEVQTVWTREHGVPRPSGIAYDPGRGDFLVVGETNGQTTLLRMGHDEAVRGVSRIPRVSDPATLTYDPTQDELTVVDGSDRVEISGADLASPNPPVSRTPLSSLGVQDPQSATVDPATGTWFVLEGDANTVAGVSPTSEPSQRHDLPPAAELIAFNPADDLLYVMSPSRDELHALDTDGNLQKAYSLELLSLADPVAMTFAPSTDPTDDPSTMNLFIADAGQPQTSGGVTEASLDLAVAMSAPVDTATLVRLTHTSQWSPASPDPSGIVWMPGPDQLVVVDSEVEEVTGAGWHDVNMWRTDRLGNVVGTGTTWGPHATIVDGAVGYSREPTGLGYDAATNTLFISDDSARKIFVLKTGPDGQFGTSDDIVTAIDAAAYGSTDTEDPEFDPFTGHLFFLDGIGMEIYRINPVDGVFGNGNDIMTKFDISHLGPKDFEGLTMDPGRGTLYVGARATKQIFEIDKDNGALIRTIDASGIPDLRFISGLAIYPATDGSGTMSMGIVDRAIDNGPDPTENDGKLFEIAVPNIGFGGPIPNQAPLVSAGADQTVWLPDPAELDGSVSDDGLPEDGQLTQEWSVVSGPGPVVFGDASAAATSAGFTTAGTYILRLTATDAELSAFDDVTISVLEQGEMATAPAFRSASSAALTGASGAELVLLRPDDVREGDLLLAQIRYRDSAAGLTTPPGWTHIGTIARSQSNHAAFYKIATQSEPTTYTFDQNTDAGRMAGGIGSYTGVDPADPISAWAASAADIPTLVAPSITTTVDNTLIVRLWGWRGSSADGSGVGLNMPPAGVTQRWSEQLGHANTDRNRVLAGDHVQATAGAVGASTASGSASSGENRRNAFTIALSPLTEGGGGGGDPPPPPVNEAPVVDAGPDQTVVLPSSAALSGSVSDDGLPENGQLTHEWSAVSGPGPVSFGNAAALSTTASFTTAGIYVLRLSASDGELSSHDDVTVTVIEPGGTGDAPEFRSASSAALTGASGSVLTIPRPAGVQAGDLLLAQIRYRNPATGLTAPPDWTLIGRITSGQGNHAAFYKIAGATEPTSYPFTQAATGGRMAGGIGAYTGVNAAAPINAWAASASDNPTLVAPNITTTVANTRIVRLWGWRGSSADGSGVGFNVPPAGVTQRWSEQLGHVNTDRNRVLAGDHIQATAGATGASTATGSASSGENRRNAFTIALSPAT